MKILDLFMITVAVSAFLHLGMFANIKFACVAVYFIARILRILNKK